MADVASLYEGLRAVCERRKSVRRFDGRGVTGEEIDKIRELAALSPYASGRRAWELRVVTDREVIGQLARLVRQRTAALGDRMSGDFRDGFLRYADTFAAFESAPALFVPIFRVPPVLTGLLAEADPEVERWERDTFVKSISCVSLLVLLAAASLGLGACYMTGPLAAERELADRLGLKAGWEVAALIPVGHPAKEPEEAQGG